MTNPRRAVDLPGGILHWQGYLSFLASSDGAQFLTRLGVDVPAGVTEAAAEELAAATDALRRDPQSKDVDHFTEASAEAVAAALSRLEEGCGPADRAVIVEYGMVDNSQTAHSYLWGILFDRLLRGEADLAPDLSAPVREALQWWRDARPVDTGDDQLINYRLAQEVWDRLREVASVEEIERIRAWAATQLVEMDLEGPLAPLGVGRHPQPFNAGDD